MDKLWWGKSGFYIPQLYAGCIWACGCIDWVCECLSRCLLLLSLLLFSVERCVAAKNKCIDKGKAAQPKPISNILNACFLLWQIRALPPRALDPLPFIFLFAGFLLTSKKDIAPESSGFAPLRFPYCFLHGYAPRIASYSDCYENCSPGFAPSICLIVFYQDQYGNCPREVWICSPPFPSSFITGKRPSFCVLFKSVRILLQRALGLLPSMVLIVLYM